MNAKCGRADLIRLHATLGPERAAGYAECFGLRPRPASHRGQEGAQEPVLAETRAQPPDEPPIATPARSRQPVPFFRVDTVEHRSPPRSEGGDPPGLTAQEVAGSSRYRPPPRRLPLAPWEHLWPRLHRQLATLMRGQPVDMERLAGMLCRGEVPRELPRRATPRWPAQLTVLIDRSERLTPFFADQDDVCRRLQTRLGRHAVLELVLPDGPESEARFPDRARERGPIAGEPVLALSDLGGYGSAADRQSWLRLANLLRRAAHPRLALCPMPARRCPALLDRAWRRLSWEPEREGPSGESGRGPAAVERVLQSLSFAVRVEPGLLRAVRRLPALRADVEVEAAAWQDRRVDGTHPVALSFASRQLPALRDGFVELARRHRAWIEQVVSLVRIWHHEVLPAEIWYEELLNLSLLAPGLRSAAETARSRQFAKRLAPSLDDPELSESARGDIIQWFRRFERRLPAKGWTDAHVGAGLVRAFCRVHRGQRPVRLPPGVDPALLGATGPRVCYELRQYGWMLRIAPQGSTAQGSLVGSFLAVAPWGLLHTRVEDTPVHLDLRVPCEIESAPEAFSLLTDQTLLAVSVCHRPAWACGVGRDRAGLWVERDLGGLRLRQRWRPGLKSGAQPSGKPGGWEDEDFSRLPPWPRWAVDSGRDPFGFWIAFEVDGRRQRMRWIEAEAPLMAAPGDGPQPCKGEWTHGYYLAETPCSQALWTAVTGERPSRTMGDEQPVRGISRDDCQRFLAALNQRLPGLDARLPTEAEWEYAYRAGTGTPRLPALAVRAPQGDHGEHVGVEPQPVRQERPNARGLYDMQEHGREWCADQPARPDADPALRLARAGVQAPRPSLDSSSNVITGAATSGKRSPAC